ncbi:large conductance mechanosensitive channel [Bartonella sp. WD16.2]|nr:large conductance mechanosensitive channel [Bartonella sp. WD16.2]
MFVKGLNKMHRQKEKVGKLKEMSLEEQLLTEIRDLLANTK